MSEDKERDLILALRDPGYSHAENILVALRKHQAAGTPHEAAVNDLHQRFIR